MENLNFKNIESVEVTSVPKCLVRICDLYRACEFNDANSQLENLKKNQNQKFAILAQLSLFQGEYEQAVEYILKYYPFIKEWYSGNMELNTIRALEFALIKIDNSKYLEQLRQMYEMIPSDRISEDKFSHFQMIPEIIDIAQNGYQKYIKYSYSPPVKTKNFDDVVNFCTKKCKGYVALSTATEVECVLGSIYEYCDINDFLKFYEKWHDSPEISEINRIDAMRAYMYLHDIPKVRQAIVDLVKYRWYAVEETDIMPMNLFAGCGHGSFDIWDILTDDLLKELYDIPKCVSVEQKIYSNALKAEKNILNYFTEPEPLGFNIIDISSISIPSGKIVTVDPFMYLNKDTKAFCQKVPKGNYKVKALITEDKRIAAVRINFSDMLTIQYYRAIIGTEPQASLDDFKYREENLGFPVGSGLATIIDDRVKKQFLSFIISWEKNHRNENIYDGFFAALFEKSAKKYPNFQTSDGDFIDFSIPNSEYHIPIFSTGYGDGFYPVFFGYDKKGKISSVLIKFIDI